MKTQGSPLCALAVLLIFLLTGCLSVPTPAPTSAPRAITGTASPPATPTPGLQSPLDAKTLNELVLDLAKTVQMQPGQTRQFAVGRIECCTFFKPVPVLATWSVSPSQGAHIDAARGLLAIEPAVPHGSVFTVSANVENGRRIVSIEVHVFTRQMNPLVDIGWREEAQFECGSGKEIVPLKPIQELQFKADGLFSVTWVPFETYRDYWGTYTHDVQKGTLQLTIAGGNYVPKDVDGAGGFSIDAEGHLILKDIWLGSPRDAKLAANCGHRFKLLR